MFRLGYRGIICQLFPVLDPVLTRTRNTLGPHANSVCVCGGVHMIGIHYANNWYLLFLRKALSLYCYVPTESQLFLCWSSSYKWASALVLFQPSGYLSYTVSLKRLITEALSVPNHLSGLFPFLPPSLPHTVCSSNINYWQVHECSMLLHTSMLCIYCFLCLHFST